MKDDGAQQEECSCAAQLLKEGLVYIPNWHSSIVLVVHSRARGVEGKGPSYSDLLLGVFTGAVNYQNAPPPLVRVLRQQAVLWLGRDN